MFPRHVWWYRLLVLFVVQVISGEAIAKTEYNLCYSGGSGVSITCPAVTINFGLSHIITESSGGAPSKSSGYLDRLSVRDERIFLAQNKIIIRGNTSTNALSICYNASRSFFEFHGFTSSLVSNGTSTLSNHSSLSTWGYSEVKNQKS